MQKNYSLLHFLLISLQNYNYFPKQPNILKENVAHTLKFIKIIEKSSLVPYYMFTPYSCFTSLITKVLSMELSWSISPNLYNTNS